MKKQVCVRTYPDSYYNPTKEIEMYLKDGYTVLMCNNFYTASGKQGNEYILEKEYEEETEEK